MENEETGEEGGKTLLFVLIVVVFLILLFVLFFVFLRDNLNCGDGTIVGKCSTVKPYFCLQGELVERASICGCLENLSEVGEECFFEYKTNPKNISLNYFFKHKFEKINFIAYETGDNYLGGLERSINIGDNFSRRDLKLKVIENEIQRELLLPLVKEIQNLEKNKKEQAEIAISLVQNIEYGSASNLSLLKQALSTKYPYEVLYENQGICGEKSDLLALLLKELGYGTAIFYFPGANHEAVGVKCPFYRDFRNTGYCYVETTGPSEINDNDVLNRLGNDEIFEIIEIAEGEKF